MNKLLLIFLVVFSTCVSAHWIPFGNNHLKDVFFYDSHGLKKRGDIVDVWYRVRYAEKSKMGNLSSQIYIQINCLDYSLKIMEATYYTDRKWANQSAMGDSAEKQNIPPDPSYQGLADMACTIY